MFMKDGTVVVEHGDGHQLVIAHQARIAHYTRRLDSGNPLRDVVFEYPVLAHAPMPLRQGEITRLGDRVFSTLAQFKIASRHPFVDLGVIGTHGGSRARSVVPDAGDNGEKVGTGLNQIAAVLCRDAADGNAGYSDHSLPPA